MRKFNKKTVALVVSIALLLCVGVGGTLAYLIDVSDPVENIFVPSQVSTWVSEENTDTEKKNVKIKNTGDIDANIRASIIVTWQNEKGEVLGQTPKLGDDYNITIGDKWELKNGFYVYKDVVAPGGFTEALIESCSPKVSAPVEDYFFCVEIVASGIQAEGISSTHPWGIQ